MTFAFYVDLDGDYIAAIQFYCPALESIWAGKSGLLQSSVQPVCISGGDILWDVRHAIGAFTLGYLHDTKMNSFAICEN